MMFGFRSAALAMRVRLNSAAEMRLVTRLCFIGTHFFSGAGTASTSWLGAG